MAKRTKALLAEFLGTFFLMATILVTVINDLPYPPVIIGVILTVIVYATGPLSGAHLNPAITLGFVLRKCFSKKLVLPYIVVQLLGAYLAVLVVNDLLQINPLSPPIAKPLHISIYGEFIGTFLLAAVIWFVATLEKTKGNNYYGVAIGGIVMAGAILFGSWSGAHFNPATLLTALLGGLTAYEHAVILLLTMIVASLSAALLFNGLEKIAPLFMRKKKT